ncbi:MAG: hypothetical protein L6R41_006127 [Letrouitia leprolyta]|nr:MAG: hypothetical protein L6R41_006127 [Letrouitia leprolyta]
MASQWPQNYQAPQGYGYNQYPQQYPQQAPAPYTQQPQPYPQQHAQQYPPTQPQPQYPPYPQQPVQQPYPSQQGAQYGGQYPPAANTTYPPPNQPQINHHGCYNCGAPSHWAQDCPEPRREVPAGAYNRPPPFKRQKPNPPVVTKYAVPPHVQQYQGQSQPTYGAQYPPPNYPQYQGPPGPPTPVSGPSPSQQQWHQQSYPQQYQQPYPQQQQQQQQYPQSYQQLNYQQQQPPYPHYQQQQQQQHPYMPTAPPTPATSYGSQYTNHLSPQTAQANTTSYFQNSQYPQQSVPQTYPMPASSPVSTASQTASLQHQPYSPPVLVETTNTNRGSRNSSVSMHSMSVTPKPQSVGSPNKDDDEGEDLNQLDIPDVPIITDDSSVNLVDRPLPSNFIVADALEPFDPPQPENDGRCQSKYVRLDASSTFMGSIKDTKYWDDFQSDPMFRSIHNSGRTISLSEIDSLYRPRPTSNEWDQTEVEDGEWTQHTVMPREENWSVTDKLENVLSAEQSTKAPIGMPRTSSWDHTLRRDHTTFSRSGPSSSDTNGLRGSDGMHRPGRNFIPPPPARVESPTLSPERTPPMRSRTPSMYELNELYQQECGTRPGSNAITGIISSDSIRNHSGDFPKRFSIDTSDPFEPPPPPAHLRKPTSYDGINEDSTSTGAPNGHTNGNGLLESHDSNSNGKSYSNGHSASPNQVRSDAASRRKRDYDQQAISDEDNTPKRRQADDTKSRLKKRQPVVAAAYR